MNRSAYKTLAAAISLSLASAAWPRWVLAQERPDEEVIVTGSFIQRSADRPQPVTIITNQDLRFEQRGTVAEIFKNVPQNVGSISMVNTEQGGGAVNMGNSPTNTTNLRGLGALATLAPLSGPRPTPD